ncbi:hypothetical protein AB0M72_06830 [Nocardiopsis dassonvillei]
MSDDQYEDPTPTGNRYVLLDQRGLRTLDPVQRVAACRDILKHTIHPDARQIMDEAVAELLGEYGEVHGKNAAVARRVGLSPSYITRIARRVSTSGPEDGEELHARLDRETVEDYTAHPNARPRAVESVVWAVESFLGTTRDAALREDWEEARVGLRAMLGSITFALDTVEGRTNPELVAEAEQIQAGEAPWQEHTYRRKVSYRDDSGPWNEHSDGPWQAGNDLSVQEAAEEAGYLVSSVYERMGQYTPGRVWKVKLWRAPKGTGEPDHVHEYVEETPPADQIRIADAIADGRLVRDGKIDNDLVRAFVIQDRAQGGDENGEQQ